MRTVIVLMLAALQTACSGSVQVQQAFPAPLVEQLPLRVVIYYPAGIADYVYHEEDASQQEWTVRLGNANLRMFDAVFSALFRDVAHAGSLDEARASVPPPDAILSPTIDAFELSSPALSGTDQFAVWIRYNLDVLAADGTLIVRWPVTAYGQSGTGGMSDEESMERATILALRDAAAAIAVGFPRQPRVREILLKQPANDGQ
ncbi:hypothetical protein GPROT2_01550 [Gammaproteobacteria bacterium]|nr:hypothetical protein [Gammaproteobacteria bacterium]QOJ31726.1 MAG: hypothetical protein HRU81_06220 [Gammaproteobacteria bacterium]CAG0942027.1 hypothetical protein GPROT2_01550 [Gammaproteobacteria bacterium]